MALKAFAPGIYPRSGALVQATRDLDRGRTSQEQVDEQAERDFRELVAVQRAAGLDLLSDGLLGWQDLFRPLAEVADGLDTRPLTRFLDTNTFYRGVLVEGEPGLASPLPAPDLPAGEWLGTLPSPLAFAHASIWGARTLAASRSADTSSRAARAKATGEGSVPSHSPAGRSGAGNGVARRGSPATSTPR